jgi:hypothetical protein
LPFYREEIEGAINKIIANRIPFWNVTCYIPALIGFLGLERGGHRTPLTCHKETQVIRCDR